MKDRWSSTSTTRTIKATGQLMFLAASLLTFNPARLVGEFPGSFYIGTLQFWELVRELVSKTWLRYHLSRFRPARISPKREKGCKTRHDCRARSVGIVLKTQIISESASQRPIQCTQIMKWTYVSVAGKGNGYIYDGNEQSAF